MTSRDRNAKRHDPQGHGPKDESANSSETPSLTNRERQVMTEHLKAAEQLTYSLHHNPNCAKPFLVRLPRGALDLKYYDETRDALGFGRSFEDAFAAALLARAASQGQSATQGEEL